MNSVERYDLTTARWTFFINLPSPRSGLQLLYALDRLWVIGGFDGTDRLRTGTIPSQAIHSFLPKNFELWPITAHSCVGQPKSALVPLGLSGLNIKMVQGRSGTRRPHEDYFA